MNVTPEFLSENNLFRGIGPETIEKYICPALKIQRFPKNSVLFQTRDKIDSIHILAQGRVKLVYYSASGDQDIRNILTAQKLLGADLLPTPTREAPYRAEALEICTLASFPADLILKPGTLPEPERAVCLTNFLTIVANINLKNELRLAALAQKGLRDRVTTYLILQARQHGSQVFEVPFTRDELACYLNVNRSALSHELSLMRQEGLIAFRKSSFNVIFMKDEM